MNDYPPFSEPTPLPGNLDPLMAYHSIAYLVLTYLLLALGFILLGMWLDRILRGHQVRRLKRQLHDNRILLHGAAAPGACWDEQGVMQ